MTIRDRPLEKLRGGWGQEIFEPQEIFFSSQIPCNIFRVTWRALIFIHLIFLVFFFGEQNTFPEM